MKKQTWRKWHKWLGIGVCAFLIVFCVSGILLNHRTAIAKIEMSRAYLPDVYHHKEWSMGLLRGTVRWDDRVLLYGSSGMWLTDTLGRDFIAFNQGLPQGADNQQVRGVVRLRNGRLFAATQFGVYAYPQVAPPNLSQPAQPWKRIPLPHGDQRLTHITSQGDSLIVLGRSYVYVAQAPYTHFERVELIAPPTYDGKVSLFKTVWLLHSGEIFGEVGKILMDFVALLLIVIAVTGIVLTVSKLLGKKSTTYRKKPLLQLAGRNLELHDFLGRKTLILALWLAFTGWCLRPPVLIALLQIRTAPLPYSTLDKTNPWHDKLRYLCFDAQRGDWLLSSSDGFFQLDSLNAVPQSIAKAPPVSVMGINVAHQAKDGMWLIGSFSGMFCWDRTTAKTYDYATGQELKSSHPIPFSDQAVSGFSTDFCDEAGLPKRCVVQHYEGCANLPQPQNMAHLPISLWNLALEAHNGRIYTFLVKPTLFFNFVIGLVIMLVIWSGWKVRLQPKRRTSLTKR